MGPLDTVSRMQQIELQNLQIQQQRLQLEQMRMQQYQQQQAIQRQYQLEAERQRPRANRIDNSAKVKKRSNHQ
jgi:hypothetical protein